MNYIENDDTTSTSDSGRVKGSVKDRVISFFYRKRFKVKLEKQKCYNEIVIDSETLKNYPRLNRNKFNSIKTVSELKLKNIHAISVNPLTEEFDFDKYDYYIISPIKKKGIGPEEEIDPVKSKLSKISSLGVKGLNNRIEESKKIVNDTKKEIHKVKINLQYPVLHREEMSKMYKNIRENIDDLKYEYEIIKGETNRRSYAFEEAIKVLDKIDKYDPNSIQTMETMLNVSMLELDKLSLNANINKKTEEEKNKEENKNLEIEVITDMYAKQMGIDEGKDKTKDEEEKIAKDIANKKIEEEKQEKESIDKKEENQDINDQIEDLDKQESLKVIDQEKDETIDEVGEEIIEEVVTVKVPKEENIDLESVKTLNMKVEKISTYEDKISYELNRQKEIIDRMYNRVGKFEKVVNTRYEIRGYGRLLSSFGNIAVGMLTLPLTNLKLFNFCFGSALINKGINKMKQGLETKEKITIDYKYEDMTRQIKDNQDKLNTTSILLSDSVNQLKQVRSEFINEFSRYQYQIPDYYKTLQSMESLEKKLKTNQEKINRMEKTLDKEEEKNKVMIKKIENKDY